MLECKISEAQEALVLIADFIKTKEDLADLEKQLNQARNRLDLARQRYQQGVEPDYEASRLVDDLQSRKFQLEAGLKAWGDRLKKYKI